MWSFIKKLVNEPTTTIHGKEMARKRNRERKIKRKSEKGNERKGEREIMMI